MWRVATCTQSAASDCLHPTSGLRVHTPSCVRQTHLPHTIYHYRPFSSLPFLPRPSLSALPLLRTTTHPRTNLVQVSQSSSRRGEGW